MKKGAMFGLDARIALAIFGALSVISGAALYSAIQSAKSEQYYQNFKEIEKALEQYYLDNSSLPPVGSNLMYVSDLTDNRENLSTWKGPYISGVPDGGQCLKSNFTNSIHSSAYICVYLQQNSRWSFSSNVQTCTVGDPDCALTITVNPHTSTDALAEINKIYNLLEEKIDNNDGNREGKIRFIDASNNTIDKLVYMTDIPYKLK